MITSQLNDSEKPQELRDPRLDWFHSEHIRPYVYVRSDNKVPNPGQSANIDWFTKKNPVFINPLKVSEVEFGNQILDLETRAFGPANMAMPRWVFYDCAITPGFVAGFAIQYKNLPEDLKSYLPMAGKHEWVPLSLFIIIPTMSTENNHLAGEWVAHNLCTVNSLFPKDKSLYGLGFLSKAFGLWYANVKVCCGFTQWGNPAIRLHSYYGPFEILTAYTPIHSYARTLTYRVKLEAKNWGNFFTKAPISDFSSRFQPNGLKINPKDESSMRDIQERLESDEGAFYLDSHEVLTKDLDQPLAIYRPISSSTSV
jgi:hypothetical protein